MIYVIVPEGKFDLDNLNADVSTPKKDEKLREWWRLYQRQVISDHQHLLTSIHYKSSRGNDFGTVDQFK